MIAATYNRYHNLIPCCWQLDSYYHLISAPAYHHHQARFCSYITLSLLVCSWLKSGQIVHVQRHLVPFNQLQLAFLSAEGSDILTRQVNKKKYYPARQLAPKNSYTHCTCWWIITIDTKGHRIWNLYKKGPKTSEI